MNEPDPIRSLLGADHRRLDALVERALRGDGTIDAEAFEAFRAGLARHIAMEEKILFPAVRLVRGAAAIPALSRLRQDHRELVAMLVPTPDAAHVRAIAALLGPHNELEEGPTGVYAQCEAILEGRLAEVLEALAAAPDVPMRPHYDGPPHDAHRR